VEQFGSGQIEARYADGVRFVNGATYCDKPNPDERRADVSL
jgi:ATP-binding cassette subfamily B protein